MHYLHFKKYLCNTYDNNNGIGAANTSRIQSGLGYLCSMNRGNCQCEERNELSDSFGTQTKFLKPKRNIAQNKYELEPSKPIFVGSEPKRKIQLLRRDV